ncbi:MAG: substrate-binding domain-containing protein [Actinobacteria bacterium]|nr:substrate-binding domain-containing protein [Actinomycetota bacterium]
MRLPTRSLAIGLALALTGLISMIGADPAAAASHTQITGSGSSWAANAVNQWIADVNKQGLQVVFTSSGSAQGRKDFAYKTTDFGVSDIAYQGKDPITQTDDTSLGRPYAYLPIVAGGTSFPYHIGNGSAMIRNLRLSGDTLAKIFTNQITYWDDSQIKSDNNNALNLPHLPIIPVVHSEGSGSTAQFTAYLAKEYGQYWGPFNKGASEMTEYFPRQGKQVAQNGSDGVINFVTSAAGNGSIAFDEYSYALHANYPVAKVLNSAGYYTAPTQYNDAVALTAAQINNDPTSINYLTQTLDNVYVNPDPRTYPLSSYSYMIIPTGSNGTETKTTSTAQRQTIADFLYYSICQGQAEMGPIGYSPLPINLVQAGFTQIAKLHAADSAVDLNAENVTTCNNPTFVANQPTVNHLAQIAPQPPACDKQGAGPCAADVGIIIGNPNKDGSAPTGQTAGTSGTSGTNGGANGGATASRAATANDTNAAGGGTVDPLTGQTVANGAGGNSNVTGQSTNLAEAANNRGFSPVLYVLAVVLLLAVLVVPAVVGRHLSGREPGGR